MTVATAVSVASSLLCLGAAGLSYRLSAAPGWREQRWYALMAVSGAGFVGCDVLFTLTVAPEVTAWASRLQLLPAAVNVVAWNGFARQYLQQRAGPFDWAMGVGLLAGALAGLVPGVAYSDVVRTISLPLIGVHYQVSEPTPGGVLLLGLDCAGLSLAAVRFGRASWAGASEARLYGIGVLALILAGVHDTLVTAELIEGPLLVDLGAVVPLAAMTLAQTGRFVQEAVNLARLSAGLEQLIEERTGDLARAQITLARAEKLAAVGTLAAGVAHEINNPAAALKANLVFLQDQGLVRPEGADAVQDSLEAVDRVVRIVSQLLASSREAAQVAPVLTRPVRVRDAVRRSLRTVRAAQADAPEVEVDVPDDLGVTGQELPLIQILTNLLRNALDAVPADRRPRVAVRARERGGAVELSVEDNGIGMTKETARRLFEPFFTTKPVGKGTGLGLSVSRGLVRSMGGDIRAESTFGEGTRMVVRLPRAQPTLETDDVTGTDGVVLAGLRVLVVEADPQVRLALGRQLGGRFRADPVADLEAARQRLLGETPPDLVLCDADGRTADGESLGAQLYRQIAAHDPALAGRFLFMTAEAITTAAQSFLERQPQPVLRKPLELEAFLAAADRVLARGRAATRG